MYFIVFLITFLNAQLTYGFNIDTNHAIVYMDPSGSSNGRSTYFGYSVLMYTNRDNITWVQIGAPRGNNSNYINITEPGVVYICNIFEPCIMVNVDASSRYRGSYGLDVSGEIFNGSWIGGTMDVHPQSGQIVVCGHRWRRLVRTDYKEYFMQGACYLFHQNETFSEKIIPLRNRGYSYLYKKGLKRNNKFYYAQGQAGTCAHFTNSQELIMGAPGLKNWDGTAIISRDHTGPFSKSSRTGRNQFLKVIVAERDKSSNEFSYEWFGYSVTSGYYFSKTELLYASGAPRKRCKGEVQVFKFTSASNKIKIETSEEGQQIGEYFGGALTTGDINRDGLDDLIVGSPYYGSNTYNTGRIYIFLGSLQGKFETRGKDSIIEGENMGGQFGASLMFLGDFNNDGYASIAVGAPYENDGSGNVYIYRGSEDGLTVLSQKLIGKSFIPTVKAFGISISKPTDIDQNFYNDLAIGAHLSSHVVILRSKPIIKIEQTLTSIMPFLDISLNQFIVKACFWYIGYEAPPEISIIRNITIDDARYLDLKNPISRNLSLTYNVSFCEIVTVDIKNTIKRSDPITVTTSVDLILQPDQLNTIIVSDDSKSNVEQDTFCKNCAILNPFLSKKQSIVLLFGLGCGVDNDICKSNLSLLVNFLNIKNNDYVVGSTDDLDVNFIVHNSAELAYQTNIIIELPKSIYIRKVPNLCFIQGESMIICNIGNPIKSNETVITSLTLDMRNIDAFKYRDTLYFNTTLETSSLNINENNNFVNSLKVSRSADILITGEASQQSYLFNNPAKDVIINFQHSFQIEKYGISPIEEVVLTILIPSGILKSEFETFTQFYTPIVMHGRQPIYCTSNAKYLSYDLKQAPDEFLLKNVNNSIIAKRSVDNIDNGESKTELGYALNRTFNINCSDDQHISCSKIECNIGPFNKQNVAKVILNMRLNVTVLSDQLGTKDIIVLSTEGKVVVKSSINFIQNGSRSDEARVSGVFIREIPEASVDYWVIIVAVIIGISLFGILTLGLIKAGFFQRKMKMDLKLLQESEELMKFGKTPVYASEDEDDQTIDKDSISED